MVQWGAGLMVWMPGMVEHSVHRWVVVLQRTAAGLCVMSGRVNGCVPGVRGGHSLLYARLLTEVLHLLLHVGGMVVRVVRLQGPRIAGMEGGPGIADTAESSGTDAECARVRTGTGRHLVVVMVVVHVLHFSGVCRGSGRGCVVAAAERHVQVARGTRHVGSGGHAHRARAIEPLHAGQVGAEFAYRTLSGAPYLQGITWWIKGHVGLLVDVCRTGNVRGLHNIGEALSSLSLAASSSSRSHRRGSTEGPIGECKCLVISLLRS